MPALAQSRFIDGRRPILFTEVRGGSPHTPHTCDSATSASVRRQQRASGGSTFYPACFLPGSRLAIGRAV
jgi:hypothetical protein